MIFICISVLLSTKIPLAAIMDRNLGALDDRYHPAADIKAKYYLFGTNIPTNGDIYCWSYDASSFTPTKHTKGNVTRKPLADINDPNGDYKTEGHNVPFLVNHPCFSIRNYGGWSSDTDIFGGTKLEDKKTIKYWNEPRPSTRIENEEVSSNVENKSFFDPCPLGWRLPVNGWVNGFRGDGSGSATGDSSVNCQWGVDSNFKNRDIGRTYVPLGYLAQKNNPSAQTIFFPASGHYPYHSNSLTYYGTVCSIWSCTPSSNGFGYRFFADSSGIIANNSSCRAEAASVRCLRE